jgi:hypothetical protein
VLDASSARAHCRVRTLVAMRMDHDRHVLRRRFIHDHFELLVGVRLLTRISIRESRTLGSARFDEVHTVV